MFDQYSRSADWAKEIINRNINKIFRVAIAIMNNKEDAEDITQSVFIKMIEKKPRFETLEHEVAWLIRVTVNMCKTELRSYRRKNSVPLIDDYPVQNEAQHDILEAVTSLSPKYRTVIHLFYYEGYSTKEIAKITKQKDSTVREQLTRARRSLGTILQGDQ